MEAEADITFIGYRLYTKGFFHDDVEYFTEDELKFEKLNYGYKTWKKGRINKTRIAKWIIYSLLGIILQFYFLFYIIMDNFKFWGSTEFDFFKTYELTRNGARVDYISN